MRLVMEIIAGRDVLSGLANAGEKVTRAIKAGVRKAGFLVERKAKAIVYDGHPEHLEGDKGGLRRSITTQVQASGYTAVIGPNVVYAAIHEFGGVIKPKKAKFLSIPVGTREGSPRKYDDLHLATSLKGQWMLVESDGTVQYLLRPQVTIPPRPYMHPALAQEADAVADIIGNTLYEAIL